MSETIRKNNNYSWVILLLVLLAVAMGAIWYFNFFRTGSEITSTYAIGEFKMINKNIINDLKELRACGDWPLIEVNRSNERGNPFSRKNLDVPVMAASSSPECLPVGQ